MLADTEARLRVRPDESIVLAGIQTESGYHPCGSVSSQLEFHLNKDWGCIHPPTGGGDEGLVASTDIWNMGVNLETRLLSRPHRKRVELVRWQRATE